MAFSTAFKMEAVRRYNRRNAADIDRLFFAAEDGDTILYRDTEEIPAALVAFTTEAGKRKIRMKAEKVKAFVYSMPTGVAPFTIAELDEIIATYEKINSRGEAIEMWYRLRDGKTTWVKDSTPFDVAGDITLDGVSIQLKYGGASLAYLGRLGLPEDESAGW